MFALLLELSRSMPTKYHMLGTHTILMHPANHIVRFVVMDMCLCEEVVDRRLGVSF